MEEPQSQPRKTTEETGSNGFTLGELLKNGNISKLSIFVVVAGISLWTFRQFALDNNLIGVGREQDIREEAIWKARVTDTLETIKLDIDGISAEIKDYRVETISRFGQLNKDIISVRDDVTQLKANSGSSLHPNDMQSWIDDFEQRLNKDKTADELILLPSVYSHMRRENNGTR